MSGQNRPIIKDSSGLQITAFQGYGNTENPGLLGGSISTVGAGTITAAAIEGQLIYRTGPTAAFTDTFPTATVLDASLGAGMDPGDCLTIDYSNQVAFAATIAGAAGVTLTSAKTSIAASAYGKLVLRKLTSAIFSTTITNGVTTTTVSTAGTYALYVL